MDGYPNKKPFTLQGRPRFQAQNLARLLLVMAEVTAQRWLKGPLIRGCGWQTEVGIRFVRDQFAHAARFRPIQEGREYLDSIIFPSPALKDVQMESVNAAVQGTWYCPPQLAGEQPILFFPGGGYIFNPQSTTILHAAISLVTRRRLFVASYPLAPEHTFPAQLIAAQRAYSWMVDGLGIPACSMIVGGASAGGNLCLALLLSLRDGDQSQPALAFLLSPWVDLANSGASMISNCATDWILLETCQQSAQLYCGQESVLNPLISPLQADLHGLGPLYIQAGEHEAFIDMIRAFTLKAERQGVDIRLDTWQNMIHCFQAFLADFPESQEALVRLKEVINEVAAPASEAVVDMTAYSSSR